MNALGVGGVFPDDVPDNGGGIDEQEKETIRGGALGRIDHFELRSRLGGGGFGVVYLARDLIGKRDVALKTLHPNVKHDEREVESLRETFSLLSRLPHEHIAPALSLDFVRAVNIRDERARRDLDLSTGDPVMVMGYAPGETLSKWIQNRFPNRIVPVNQALEIGRQVADALDYAHRHQVVHRDIKPSNLVVEDLPDRSGVCVRVLDFGLAERIHSRVSQGRYAEKRAPEGTYQYMAPEQWTGDPQDGRTDQYALACILHEMLTGAPPFADAFAGQSEGVIQNIVLTREPERHIPGVPAALARVLARALSKNLESRYSTCLEFLEAARNALEEGTQFEDGGPDTPLGRRDRDFLSVVGSEFLSNGHPRRLAALASEIASARYEKFALSLLDRFSLSLLDELAASNAHGGSIRPLDAVFSGRGKARLAMVDDIPERTRTEVQRRIGRLLAVVESLCR